MIDVNVALGSYPFRDLPDGEPTALRARLRTAGVTQAWTSSLDGWLHRDLAAVNARLADACRRADAELFVPFGVIHPGLPGWEDDVRRCVEIHQMPGLRLFPSYHQYDFSLPALDSLFALAEKHGLIVQIAWRLEDERTEHPLLQPSKLAAEPLYKLVAAHPQVRVVLLNSQRDLQSDALNRLIQAGDVSFDFAMLEGAGCLEGWIRNHPYQRLLFGSFAPVFIHQSACLKLQESQLPRPIREAVVQSNARQLLKQHAD